MSGRCKTNFDFQIVFFLPFILNQKKERSNVNRTLIGFCKRFIIYSYGHWIMQREKRILRRHLDLFCGVCGDSGWGG